MSRGPDFDNSPHGVADWVNTIHSRNVIRRLPTRRDEPVLEQTGDLSVGFEARQDQWGRDAGRPIVVVTFTPELPDDDAIFEAGYEKIKEDWGTKELWRSSRPVTLGSDAPPPTLRDFDLPVPPPDVETHAGVLLRRSDLQGLIRPSDRTLTRFGTPTKDEMIAMQQEMLVGVDMFPGAGMVGGVLDRIENAIVEKGKQVWGDFVHDLFHPIQKIDNPSFMPRNRKK